MLLEITTIDFNAVWALVQPYVMALLSSGTLVTVIVSVIKIYIVIKQKTTAMKATVDANADLGTRLSSVISSAIPDTVNIDIENLVKGELVNLVDGVNKKIDKVVSEKVDELTRSNDLILQALICLKSLPDELRGKIADSLLEPPKKREVTIQLTSKVGQAEDTKKAEADTIVVPIE